jgi:hypothetical protein
VSWPVVTRPKELGGLAIADLKSLGSALRVRWLWLQKNPTRQALGMLTSQNESLYKFFLLHGGVH